MTTRRLREDEEESFSMVMEMLLGETTSSRTLRGAAAAAELAVVVVVLGAESMDAPAVPTALEWTEEEDGLGAEEVAAAAAEVDAKDRIFGNILSEMKVKNRCL